MAVGVVVDVKNIAKILGFKGVAMNPSDAGRTMVTNLDSVLKVGVSKV